MRRDSDSPARAAGEAPHGRRARGASLAVQIDRLLAESSQDGWALITPSPYETARLVSIAPWLNGHAARLRYLCAEQKPDGGWGVDGFRLVPTLSATEALLTACRRDFPGPSPVARDTAAGHTVTRDTVVKAASRGLDVLRGWLADGSGTLPDTVAIELIVPRLIALINERLQEQAQAHGPSGPVFADSVPLPPSAGTVPALLEWLRQQVSSGLPVPGKLWHTWETLSVGQSCPAEVPLVGGVVSCSPAATAAWLGGPQAPGHPAVRFLDDLQRRGQGPVPVATPMPYFERSWILAILASHRIPHTVPAGMLATLRAALGPDGLGAGPGLTPDADDTAVTLHALGLNGHDQSPESLMGYFGEDHFRCYPEERTASPTTNAHSLEALTHWISRHPTERERYLPVIRKTVDWLIAAQDADGSWTDKWHGSPYYATACCARALDVYGSAYALPAVERAISWVLGHQHASGWWGHGHGTVEETAYAAWILALSRSFPETDRVRAALASAEHVLASGTISEHSTTLWIGKDVYTPLRIAQVTRLVMLYRMRGRTGGRRLPEAGKAEAGKA